MARDGAAPEDWAGLCRAARRGRAARRRPGRRRDGPPRLRRRPRDPEQRRPAARASSWGVARARGGRAAAATAPPGRDRRDAHRPAQPPHLCRVGAGLVGIDPSRTTALRPALTLTAPVVARPRRARRHVRSATATPGRRPRRTHLGPAPRSGTPTGCRGPPPAAPRCCVARAAAPAWSGGSRWTRSSSTSATTRRALGETRDRLRARRRGRADGRRVGGLGRHHRARDRHRHRRPGARRRRPAPRCTRSCDEPRRRHRRRRELRARRLPRLGRGGRRGARPPAYDVVR